jgi:ketol-acid reductoisomerase
MRNILREVKDGSFISALLADSENGYKLLKADRAKMAAHPIERARARMEELKGKS